jgi:hypothetical protein
MKADMDKSRAAFLGLKRRTNCIFSLYYTGLKWDSRGTWMCGVDRHWTTHNSMHLFEVFFTRQSLKIKICGMDFRNLFFIHYAAGGAALAIIDGVNVVMHVHSLPTGDLNACLRQVMQLIRGEVCLLPLRQNMSSHVINTIALILS